MTESSEHVTLREDLTISANGRVLIPALMRKAMGLSRGGRVSARLSDGAVILESHAAAIRRAQALVARYVPGEVDLVAELIADRRAEAARE